VVHRRNKNVYRTLFGKLQWKALLGRARSKWEDNIKTDCGKTGCEDAKWIELVHDKV
jgi:hypothetical protein